MGKGRAAPPAQQPRPAEWGPWEWRNHLVDERARERRAKPHASPPSGMSACCLNNVYSVLFFVKETEWGAIDHLMIRRHDEGAMVPWADMQRIKNELLGAERLGIQVYPPESKLVDEANIYHLWVLPPGAELPFTLRI